MKIFLILSILFSASFLSAKSITMRQGYRQLKFVEFPKNRSGILTFIYSEASGSGDSYLKNLNRTQKLMMDTIIASLIGGRVPMANSIWKKFVKSLHNNSISFNINNILFNIIQKAYMEKKYTLRYRAKLYKVLNDKVEILSIEKRQFKDLLKNCDDHQSCDYTTKDEIDRTYDLWKRRTKIFKKEMKRARKRFNELYDEEDGHARLTQQVSFLFFESAEAILSEN